MNKPITATKTGRKSPAKDSKPHRPIKTTGKTKSRQNGQIRANLKTPKTLPSCQWCKWAGIVKNSTRAAKDHLRNMGYPGPQYPTDDLVAAKVRELLSLGDKKGRHDSDDMAGLKLRKLRAETHRVEQALTASRADLLRRYREEVLLAILSQEYAPICAECRKWIPPNQRRAFNAVVDRCDKSLSEAMETRTAEWLRGLEIE